jgi:hypothetical protein
MQLLRHIETFLPNAGGEPRPEAEAQRKLEGVGSSARLCENPDFGHF